MSRYTVPTTKPKVKFTYGYDLPLQSYFFQVEKGARVIDDDGMGGCSASKVLAKAEEHGATLPEEHAMNLALDLPI